MITRFNQSIFHELEPLLPKDLLADAHLLGFNPKEMYLSIYTLSSDLQHVLRQRGKFEEAHKVQLIFSQKLECLARLDTASQTDRRDRKHNVDDDNCTPTQKKTCLFQTEGDMEVSQVGVCALGCFEHFSPAPSVITPQLQPDASSPCQAEAFEWHITDHEADQRMVGLRSHAYACSALLRFKININMHSPQEIVKKIAIKSREIAKSLRLCLPCLPIHLSANPQDVADMFDGIYKAGILDFLERLATAGSTTSRAIVSKLAEQEEIGASLAVQLAFEMGQQCAPIIRQELQASGIMDIACLFQGLSFYPHDFLALFCAE
jgi:hypothetical protein